MILTSKYVIPITSSYIENGGVLVQGDKIVEVGPSDYLREKYPDEKVRDFGLSAIMPGFVDVNAYLGHAALRGMFDDLFYADWRRKLWRHEPFLSYEDWVDSSRLGTLEAVASGITTMACVSLSGAPTIAINEIGLRARIYCEAITAHKERTNAVVEQAVERTKRLKAKTDDNKRISYGLAAGPVYLCHPQLYTDIADYAKESGMPIAIHLAGSQEEADFIRYGSSPFSIHASDIEALDFTPPWLPTGSTPVRYVENWGLLEVPELLAIHCIHVDNHDIESLRDNDVAIGFCPRINAKLGMGIAPVISYLKNGMRVGLGTASPVAVDTTDMIDEARIGLMIMRAVAGSAKLERMSADKMLHMATIDAAAALRMDKEIGSLESGKLADIIVIDLHNSHQTPTSNPQSAIIYTANQDNVMMTMVGGRILYDNFTHISGVDRDGIVEKARALRSRVRDQVSDEKLRLKKIDDVSEDLRERFNR